MGSVAGRIGNVQIQLTGLGAIHLSLALSDVGELMSFLNKIMRAWHTDHPRGSGSLAETRSPGSPSGTIGARFGWTGNLAPAAVAGPSDTVDRPGEAMEARIRGLEERVEGLVRMSERLIECLARGNTGNAVGIPSPGTKYGEFLGEIFDRFGGARFQSRQVAGGKRHILSILRNQYGALEVVETRGRANIYQLRRQVVERILGSCGVSSLVEVRGKDRGSCDAFFGANRERNPDFAFSFLEGTGVRQRYLLLFKGRPVQLSVMADLSRFVGERRNLVLQRHGERPSS